jgi:hypothetical protein
MPKPKSSSTAAPTTASTHAQAYALLALEIAAVPDTAIITITTDIPLSVETAFVVADRIESLMPLLSKLPPECFDLPRVRKLRLYAGALLYTHVLTMAPKPESELPALLEEAVGLRRRLLAIAEGLAELGLVSAEHVAAIRSGTGHRDTANDLTALANLYDEGWKRFGERIPITREEVDRAAVLGTRLTAMLGDRRLESDAPERPEDARRIRARAYTLFMDVYDSCQQMVTSVRWKHGDADRYVPSLYPRRPRRPVAGQGDEPEELLDPSTVAEPEPEPAPPVPPVIERPDALVSG